MGNGGKSVEDDPGTDAQFSVPQAGNRCAPGSGAQAQVGRAREDGPEAPDGPARLVAPGSADRCPRCGGELGGAEACGRCGLARRHHDRFAKATVLPAELAAEWERVLAAWDDPGRHALFLERCARDGSLDLAAARYRPLAGDAERGARARAALDRIVALAERELRRAATPRDTLRRNRRIVFVVALAIAIVFLVVIARAVLAR